MYSNLQMMLY